MRWWKLIYSVCVGANSEGEVSKTFYQRWGVNATDLVLRVRRASKRASGRGASVKEDPVTADGGVM
jgi:hypothetical protein